MMTRFRRALTGVAVLALLGALLVVPASAAHVLPGPPTTTLNVQPEGIHGNPTCSDVTGNGFLFEFKTEEAGEHDLDFDGLEGTVTVTTSNTAQGQVFDFSFDGDFVAATVVVKGGPDANLYDYLAAHAPGAEADTSLHAPINPNNSRFYGVSHISFCLAEAPSEGFLKVNKFIDVNADGVLDAGDLTSDDGSGNLAGWEFNVYAGDSTDAADLIDTLTTGSDGMTEELTVEPGTYTVEEANTGKTILTAVDGGSATELTSDGDGTLDNTSTNDVAADEVTEFTFGNACLISKTFEVTNAAGLTGVFVIYDVNDPLNDGDGDHRVDLTGPDANGAWSGTVKDLLRLGDTVNWTFGSLVDGSEQTHPDVASDTVPNSSAYPICLDTNQRTNAPARISGLKVKDMNDDGIIQDEERLQGLANFVFELRQDGSVLATAVSDANGEFTFPDEYPAGTYTIHELGVSADSSTTVDADLTADWVQTVPADGGSRTVTVGLDDNAVTADPFANAPLSDIGLFFVDRTGFTNVRIVCEDGEGNVILDLDPAAAGYEDPTPGTPLTLEDLRIADNTFSCDFEIIDP